MSTQTEKAHTQPLHHAVAFYAGHEALVPAVRELHAQGLGNDQISILAKDEQALARAVSEVGASDGRVAHAPERLAVEAEPQGEPEAAGMVIGGGVGLLIGLSAIALPGLGAFLLAAGPVAIALHGLTFAAGGLGLGALVGAILDEGATEEHKERYAHALESGQWMVVVHGDQGAVRRAQDVLTKNGATRVDTF